MWPRFGIKIGNSTFSVAYAKEDGNVEIIANDQGDRVSPAVLLADGDEIEVGLTAKQKVTSKPLAVAVNSFQFFAPNLKPDDVEKCVDHIPNNFSKETLKYELQSQGEEFPVRNLTPYEICVEIFKATFGLARQWQSSVERPPVVLSIPSFYQAECREHLARAAEEAGFHVAQVLSEPAAAVVAYKIGDDGASKRVMYIRSGGLLTSFTLLNTENKQHEIIATSKKFYIGGHEVTKAIVEFITKEFRKKYGDPTESRRSMAKIQNAAQDCKHILTTLQTTQIYIDSLMDGIDFNLQMSRPRFESLIQPVVSKFMTILNSAVETMNKDQAEIDEIVLAGGNMKVPAIQSAIKDRFPNAKIHATHHPDEVIAIGCARQSMHVDADARILEDNFEIHTLSNDVHIWLEGNENNKILVFERHAVLPCRKILDVNARKYVVENGEISKDRPVFCISTGEENLNTAPVNVEWSKEVNGYSIKVTAKISKGPDDLLISVGPVNK